jgi:hypothetical protein
VARTEEIIVQWVFMEGHLGEGPAGNPTMRPEDTSKLELKEMGCDNGESIKPAQVRVD